MTSSTEKAVTDTNVISFCIVHFISVLSQDDILRAWKAKWWNSSYVEKLIPAPKILIIDEISMIGRKTFGHLNVALKAIMQNLSQFGGVYFLVVGDFF